MGNGIEFFGKVDRNRDGRIVSEYPAGYFKAHKEELEESIARKERELARGTIAPTEVMYAQQELAREKKRLDEIEKSTPKLTDIQKDELTQAREGLGMKIKDSMFTRSDMMLGLASAHEEASRMADPCILLTKEEQVYADACGIRVDDGRVSRNNASRIYKIISQRIGEPSNVEALRKDRVKGR